MANPFPFVAGNVLTAAQLNGIGEWTAYTPTMTGSVTNPTIGNSVLTGRYARIQNLIICNWSVTLGSTFVNGVGDYFFALPVNAAAVNAYNKANWGTAAFFDASTTNYYGSFNPFSEFVTKVRAIYTATYNGAAVGWSATAPVIPAVGDIFSGLVIYEAA